MNQEYVLILQNQFLFSWRTHRLAEGSLGSVQSGFRLAHSTRNDISASRKTHFSGSWAKRRDTSNSAASSTKLTVK